MNRRRSAKTVAERASGSKQSSSNKMDKIASSYHSASETTSSSQNDVEVPTSSEKPVKTSSTGGNRSAFETTDTTRITAVIPTDTNNQFIQAVAIEITKEKAPNGSKKNISYCVNEALNLWLKEKNHSN